MDGLAAAIFVHAMFVAEIAGNDRPPVAALRDIGLVAEDVAHQLVPERGSAFGTNRLFRFTGEAIAGE